MSTVPAGVDLDVDLDLDFIRTQLRGTFDARVEEMLGLPVDHPSNAAHLSALDAINAALARIHAGTYGRCEGCTAPIGAARLEVIPTTTRCAPCQAEAARA